MSTAETIAAEARNESAAWASSLRAVEEWQPVFSPLAPAEFALGLETVYEAYLVHYGAPRLFHPPDRTEAVLLGDYLYAHGLVRVASFGDVDAVGDLSELISLCSQLRAEDASGDGPLWAATAALLGAGRRLDEPRAALRLHGDASLLDAAARATAGEKPVEQALAAHRDRFGGRVP